MNTHKGIIVTLLCFAMASCSKSPSSIVTSQVYINTDYICALSAANEFLSAWRARHRDKGIASLSPRLLQTKGEQWWRDEISGISNPHHEAYEICNGHRLADGRFVFDVWLYEHYTGDVYYRGKRWGADKIVLVKVGPEKWKVDEISSFSF